MSDLKENKPKGMIVDVYPEGSPAYRGCVQEDARNGLYWVINLDSGKLSLEDAGDCETVINDIFSIEAE